MISISEKKDCTGCHGCANICPKRCISMIEDSEGFRYPTVDKEKCINCNLCERVCPILNRNKINNKPVAIASYSKNKEIRMKSSSGGIFSLIAEEVINKSGVVFGAKFNEKFDVIHDYTESMEGISKFRGAKYVQSIIGDTYSVAKKFLEGGRQVVFSGTPCQIGGLKRYLLKEYSNLLCIDLICHGVPSPIAWRKYKESFNNEKKIEGIYFRDKTYGWKNYSFKVDFEDKSHMLIKRNQNSFMDGFINNIYLRPSCHDCKFKSIQRESDITLADFWGIENIRKDIDDDKGTSLVLINSKRGKDIIFCIDEKIEKVEVDINEAIKYNSSAIKSSYNNPRRKYFFKRINRVDFDKLVDKSLMGTLNVRLKVRAYEILKKCCNT